MGGLGGAQESCRRIFHESRDRLEARHTANWREPGAFVCRDASQMLHQIPHRPGASVGDLFKPLGRDDPLGQAELQDLEELIALERQLAIAIPDLDVLGKRLQEDVRGRWVDGNFALVDPEEIEPTR